MCNVDNYGKVCNCSTPKYIMSLFEEGIIGLNFIDLSMEIFGLEMMHH
jgi:hypothetical protein